MTFVLFCIFNTVKDDKLATEAVNSGLIAEQRVQRLAGDWSAGHKGVKFNISISMQKRDFSENQWFDFQELGHIENNFKKINEQNRRSRKKGKASYWDSSMALE